MDRPGTGTSVERTFRLARLIVLALAFGVVIFGTVAFMITLGGRPLGGGGFSQPFLLGLAVFGIALVGAHPVVRRTMIAGFRPTSGGEASTTELAALFMRLTIVGAAMAEAFCLFSLIAS